MMLFRKLFAPSPSSQGASSSDQLLRSPNHDEFIKLDAFIKDNNLEEFRALVESERLDVNVPYIGLSLLHRAVAVQIADLQKQLASAANRPNGATVTTSEAASQGDGEEDPLAIMRYLVKDRSANVTVRAADGTTPFDASVFDGILPVVRFFIEECGYSVDTVSTQGFSAAFLSSHDDTIATLQYFIDSGCSVDAPSNVSAGDYIAALMKASASHTGSDSAGNNNTLPAFARSEINNTPFYGAALSGSVAAAQALLDAGCDLGLAHEVLLALPQTSRLERVTALLMAESLK